MSDLIIVSFKDEATAFEARAALVRLQKEYLLQMEDAVVITRSEDGAIKLHQPVNLTLAGAAGGTFWGLLVGMIFFNPLLGAVVGAGAGAVTGAMSDLGIDDKFLKEVGTSLGNGQSAIAVLIRNMTVDKVLAQLEAFHAQGHVIQTSLTTEQEEKLRAVLEQKPAGLS